MKIYTKTGDKGETSLYGGKRVRKYDIRIESYGTVDELNSYIGLIRDQNIEETLKADLIKIQNDLFTIGAMLATPLDKEKLKNGRDRLNIPKINDDNVSFLESSIDNLDSNLPIMKHFILPGGHPCVSYCHISRCICRRAERIAVELSEQQDISTFILSYLNRLSDYLFVLARNLTSKWQLEEIAWIPEKNS